MTASNLRQAIWDSMLDADMNVRYWAYLGETYYSRERYLQFFLTVMASGTVAGWGLWEHIPWLWKILSSISALLAILLQTFNLPKRIEKMATLKRKWLEIKSEYEILFLQLSSKGKNNDSIFKQYQKIMHKENEASTLETNFKKNDKLIDKCYEEVIISRGLT